MARGVQKTLVHGVRRGKGEEGSGTFTEGQAGTSFSWIGQVED